MTNVKGALNVDQAVTLDSTLDVTGDTSVSTFDSTGATSLATAGGAVNIASSGAMTNVKGALNVDQAVTLSGNLITANNTAQIPVTYSTFTLVTANLNTDLSALGGFTNNSYNNTYQDASDWTATRTPLSIHSYIKMEFKANFISSPEVDQTLSFKVLRSIDDTNPGDNYNTNTAIFEDTEIGSNMGVTIRSVYNGTFIDDLKGEILGTAGTVSYKLQVKRNKASGDTIVTPFGIVPGGNYIFLQELYQPSA